ncbi:hypothetical protein JTB14_038477 [Gonioctena quinquepunctata]|nr:hypothetical protein JTB14_038477 [Gonioctena quinquepunctata]
MKDISQEGKDANAFLRERYLYLISSMCGSKKQCNINMYENTEVTGTIKAVDKNFENIIVENVKTPLPEPNFLINLLVGKRFIENLIELNISWILVQFGNRVECKVIKHGTMCPRYRRRSTDYVLHSYKTGKRTRTSAQS